MDRNLIEYLPEIMQAIREIKVVMDAEQPEFSDAWDKTFSALDDQFVQSATENGVSRWENILDIIPKATEELDTRKFRILTRLNEQLPYTVRSLEQQLSSMCGEDEYTLELLNSEYTIVIRVGLIAKNNFGDVKDLLNRIVPANMVIDVSLKYNSHADLERFTFEELEKFTHDEIRSEVLN